MNRSLRLLVGMMLLLFAASLPSYGSSLMFIAPAVSNVSVGQTFTVDVNVDIDIITDSWGLYAYQFDLGFDPSLLEATAVNDGGFLVPGGSPNFFEGFIDNSAGTVSFVADSLTGPVSGPTGEGTLATTTFQALASGTDPLVPLNVILLNSEFDYIDAPVIGGEVDISGAAPVPEPSTILLLAGGLTVLAAVSRVRR